MLKPILAAAAVIAASALVGPTVSQAATTNSYRVSYADLNLASDHGRQSLQRRIAFGARVVCEIEDSRELALAAATNACRGDAVESARPEGPGPRCLASLRPRHDPDDRDPPIADAAVPGADHRCIRRQAPTRFASTVVAGRPNLGANRVDARHLRQRPAHRSR